MIIAPVELSQYIVQAITEYVDTSSDNSLGDIPDEKAWGTPLVGFSRGDDPLYLKIKEDIGSFYWTPQEIFSLTYPESRELPEDLTVISWVLPQTEKTKSQMRVETNYPSRSWALSRTNGQNFNDKVAQYAASLLTDKGFRAVSPSLSPLWSNKRSERYGYASTWSERHTAFISGLGTFGLSDGLITPVGKAVRLGSIVADIKLPPTKRDYEDYNEYCLHFARGLCRKCAERCPAGAITIKGHDKLKCREYQNQVTSRHNEEAYGIKSGCCGLCQTKVPCESGIPLKIDSLKRG